VPYRCIRPDDPAGACLRESDGRSSQYKTIAGLLANVIKLR
jgi:hypothetical protein